MAMQKLLHVLIMVSTRLFPDWIKPTGGEVIPPRQSPIADRRYSKAELCSGKAIILPVLAHDRWVRPCCSNMASRLKRRRNRSTPLQCHGHVSRHAAGKIDDFDPQ